MKEIKEDEEFSFIIDGVLRKAKIFHSKKYGFQLNFWNERHQCWTKLED